jgi:hypothetical protein
VDRNLYFDSPYITARDRTLGDLITARLSLEDDPLIRQIFERSPDPIQRIADNLMTEIANDPIDAFELAQKLLKKNPPNPMNAAPSPPEDNSSKSERHEDPGSTPKPINPGRSWRGRYRSPPVTNEDLPPY